MFWTITILDLYFKVAELYDELKRRVSQFNMHVTEDTQPSDYTSTHKQRFILQVNIDPQFAGQYCFVIGSLMSIAEYDCFHDCVLGGHCWRLLPQLLCPEGNWWTNGYQRHVWTKPSNHSDGISFRISIVSCFIGKHFDTLMML